MREHEFGWAENMLLLDRANEASERDVSYSFALDELLCKQVGEGGQPICHIWRHPRAFVMGTRDSRLPGAAEACRWLESEGYEVLVRHSGGAAVPLDSDVVNLSLIMPVAGKSVYGGFRDDFERMYALISRTLGGFGATVNKGEVEGSYCPGDYDLHIDGLKFCGIAQRRQVKAMIIQAFVLAGGSGIARAELVKAFYERAGVGAKPGAYPLIVPSTMSSLEERRIFEEQDGEAAERFRTALHRTFADISSIATSSSNDELVRLRLPHPDVIRSTANLLGSRYPLPR
jgi:octanoyl-[GcvH]:protein N-octanoyltransferase